MRLASLLTFTAMYPGNVVVTRTATRVEGAGHVMVTHSNAQSPTTAISKAVAAGITTSSLERGIPRNAFRTMF